MQLQQQTFAPAPGLVRINTTIDYSNRIGAELYWSGSSSLLIKFNGEEENLLVFTDALMDCTREMGWGNSQASILSIAALRNSIPVHMNLIEEFRRYRLQGLRDQVLTYYNLPTRQAQNGHMMYYCIINTIIEESNRKVIEELKNYVFNGINSGPLLLKFLTSVITIDTRATITNIRMDLTNLDTYISTFKFDINKFNSYLKEKRKQLRKRGEILLDISVNLFKAYKVVPDQIFHNWLIRKKENYEEGIEFTPDSLVLDALNQYQSFKNKRKMEDHVFRRQNDCSVNFTNTRNE